MAKLSTDNREKILNLAGYSSVREIADALGCSKTAVYTVLNENGQKAYSSNSRNAQKRELIQSLAESGKSTKEIADYLNCSKSLVYSSLKDAKSGKKLAEIIRLPQYKRAVGDGVEGRNNVVFYDGFEEDRQDLQRTYEISSDDAGVLLNSAQGNMDDAIAFANSDPAFKERTANAKKALKLSRMYIGVSFNEALGLLNEANGDVLAVTKWCDAQSDDRYARRIEKKSSIAKPSVPLETIMPPVAKPEPIQEQPAVVEYAEPKAELSPAESRSVVEHAGIYAPNAEGKLENVAVAPSENMQDVAARVESYEETKPTTSNTPVEKRSSWASVRKSLAYVAAGASILAAGAFGYLAGKSAKGHSGSDNSQIVSSLEQRIKNLESRKPEAPTIIYETVEIETSKPVESTETSKPIQTGKPFEVEPVETSKPVTPVTPVKPIETSKPVEQPRVLSAFESMEMALDARRGFAGENLARAYLSKMREIAESDIDDKVKNARIGVLYSIWLNEAAKIDEEAKNLTNSLEGIVNHG